MRVEQLVYTSCRRGKANHAGFQIRAASVDLPADDEREVLRFGDYKRPNDSPALPDSEKEFHRYPVAFHFYRLPSGRLAITRSVYAGRDGGGRPGNFLAHTLVLDAELPIDRWPVDLIEWPGWQDPLAPNERDSEAPPPPLPSIEIDPLPAGESFGWADLAEFLDEDPRRRSWLAAMIEAILSIAETSRPVVIRCPAWDAAFWVACLQKTLPPPLSTRLGFSTYQFDPWSCTDVNVTSGQTSFELDETDRQFRFFVFDWDTGTRSDVEPPWPGFGESVVDTLCERPSQWQDFFGWLRGFDVSTVVQLPVAWASYRWLSEGGTLGDDDLAIWLGFWATAHAETRLQLNEQIWQRLDSEQDTLRLGELEELIAFYVESASDSGLDISRQRGVELWLRVLARACGGDAAASVAARRIWGRWVSTRARARGAVARHLLDAEPWALGRQDSRVEDLHLLLEVSVWALRHGTDEAPWPLEIVRCLLRAMGASSDGRRRALEVARAEVSALEIAIVELVEAAEAAADGQVALRDLGAALAAVLDKLDAAVAMSLRRQLEARSCWEVLFGEWLERLAAGRRAGDLRATVRRYETQVLAGIPHFADATRGWRAASLLDGASKRDQLQQAVDWLDSGELENLPSDLLATGFHLANETLTLDRVDEVTAARSAELRQLAASRGLTPSPDRPYLRSMLDRAGDEALDAEALKRIGWAMVELDAAEANHYLGRIVPLACRRFTTLRDHDRLLEHLSNKGDAKQFGKIYTRTLSRLHGRALVAALRFWHSDQPASPRIARLQRGARTALRKCLVRLPNDEMEAVHRSMTKSGPAIRARWKELEEGIAARRRGIVGKTVRWFAERHRRDRSKHDAR